MKVKIALMVALTMGFTILLVIGLIERNVVILLINETANVSEENIRLTFSALQRIVGVLPYTLGAIIAGSLVFSILQLLTSGKEFLNIAVLIVLLIPLIYNIFIADTALVVEQIENTRITDELSKVRVSLMGAVQQHFVGLIGFMAAATLQLINTLLSTSKSRA